MSSDNTTFSFTEYQHQSRSTADYPQMTVPVYAALGLVGEAGEVAENIKKAWRNPEGMTIERTQKTKKELGDVLWYVAQVATDMGFDLGDVAMENLNKLRDRAARGQIKAEGDER